MQKPNITVVGGGLAGSEAAWQAASLGVHVTLIEMKPGKHSPAHSGTGLGELVCSNSLKSDDIASASGLLKEELRRFGSVVMEAADRTRVPAGAALAVDREKFSEYITEKIKSHPNITLLEGEVTELPEDGITVIATGPLTSSPLAAAIADFAGSDSLYFFDAAAPIVDASSIDMERAFFASRYDKGTRDYINCGMTEEEYLAFYGALITAKTAALHDFDGGDGEIEKNVFESCMPIEIMAKRGNDTIRYGPLRPVGIRHPETGQTYHAVVQLRRENAEGTIYNLVGFQTHLTFPEQKRVFSMIPGLRDADFLRYGVMHRNTFLNSPELLSPDFSVKTRPELFFAGQMTGVEGYMESTASGMLAGINAACRAHGLPPVILPVETVTGALADYCSRGAMSGNFQPMNANFGIVPMPEYRIKGGKKAKYEYYSERGLKALAEPLRLVKDIRNEYYS